MMQERGHIEKSIVGLLKGVSKWERFRSIMSHMLLSPALPYAKKERLIVLETIFEDLELSVELEESDEETI